MLAIAFITLRESLEMLLIGTAVYSALIELKIYKKRELLIGASLGLILTLFLFVLVSFAGTRIRFDVTHEMGELFEGVNYVGTGIFLFLTAILLHNKMKQIVSISPSFLLESSLFAVGFLTVLREGIEIVFFSLSSSIVSSFSSSLVGFLLGLGVSSIIGIVGIKFAKTKLSHRKLLTISEWGIKLLSFYFIMKGLIGLSEYIL
jgi:FTR1 family protein